MNTGFLCVFAVTPAAGGEYYSCLLAVPAVVGLLGAIAAVAKLISYVLNSLDDVYAFIGAVGRCIWRRRVRIAQCCVAALVMGGLGAAVWAAHPATPEPLRKAGRLETAITRDEAALQSEMDKTTALMDAEGPGKFDLYQEMATTEALRQYVDKLLRLGESAVASMGRMRKTARELDVLLKEAPARYREAAALERRYEEEEQYPDIKENYRALAVVFEAKAKAAELHQGDVQNTLNSHHLEDYLKRQNIFLARFSTLLSEGLTVKELRDVVEFTKTLRDVAKGHEQLRGLLKTWRERMTNEVSGPAAPK